MDSFNNYINDGRGFRPVFTGGSHSSGCYRVETRLSTSDRDEPMLAPLSAEGRSFGRWGRFRDPGDISEDIL